MGNDEDGMDLPPIPELRVHQCHISVFPTRTARGTAAAQPSPVLRSYGSVSWNALLPPNYDRPPVPVTCQCSSLTRPFLTSSGRRGVFSHIFAPVRCTHTSLCCFSPGAGTLPAAISPQTVRSLSVGSHDFFYYAFFFVYLFIADAQHSAQMEEGPSRCVLHRCICFHD